MDWLDGDKGCSDEYPCLKADDNKLWKERVTFIQGIPTDPNITALVQAELDRVKAKKVIVVEDGSHAYETVLENAKAYAKYVTPGLYMIIQDAKMTRFYKNQVCGEGPTQREREECYVNFPKVGPGDAIPEFLASNPEFQSDPSWEYLFYTQHPKGFLRKALQPS